MKDKRYNKLPSIAKWAKVAFVRVKMTHTDFLKKQKQRKLQKCQEQIPRKENLKK
jgi:hypothetical protein